MRIIFIWHHHSQKWKLFIVQSFLQSALWHYASQKRVVMFYILSLDFNACGICLITEKKQPAGIPISSSEINLYGTTSGCLIWTSIVVTYLNFTLHCIAVYFKYHVVNHPKPVYTAQSKWKDPLNWCDK